MSSTIRVLIVDDHEIVRKGIRALLATKRDIQVVGEARDGAKAVTQAQVLVPDVILMDLMMLNMNVIQATRAITAGQPVYSIPVLARESIQPYSGQVTRRSVLALIRTEYRSILL